MGLSWVVEVRWRRVVEIIQLVRGGAYLVAGRVRGNMIVAGCLINDQIPKLLSLHHTKAWRLVNVHMPGDSLYQL